MAYETVSHALVWVDGKVVLTRRDDGKSWEIGATQAPKRGEGLDEACARALFERFGVEAERNDPTAKVCSRGNAGSALVFEYSSEPLPVQPGVAYLLLSPRELNGMIAERTIQLAPLSRQTWQRWQSVAGSLPRETAVKAPAYGMA